MAKGDTKTNQYLGIAANGTRADLPASICCETRSQTLIRGVAERIMDLEDEVKWLENNPDVADVVATYADLQAYDTAQLTDKDIVRVLQDETRNGDSTYYRWSTQSNAWTYIGESKQYTDFVGTDGTANGEAGLVPAPTTEEAGFFLNASGGWEEIAAGGVIELTTDDYNYPANGPTGIAPWLLDGGIYVLGEDLKIHKTNSSAESYIAGTVFAVLRYANGATSFAYTYVLLPSSSGCDLYKLQTNSGGPIATGSIATTYDLFADPGTRQQVRIGVNSNSTGVRATAVGVSAAAEASRATALGDGARAGAYNSVAVGRGSLATHQGQMDIGDHNNEGYNSSSYRLLTGLYDPQSDHDAATKGYVDNLVGDIEAALSVINNGGNS